MLERRALGGVKKKFTRDIVVNPRDPNRVLWVEIWYAYYRSTVRTYVLCRYRTAAIARARARRRREGFLNSHEHSYINE